MNSNGHPLDCDCHYCHHGVVAPLPLDREIAVINRAAVINHPGTDHQWNMNGHCALCGIADIA